MKMLILPLLLVLALMPLAFSQGYGTSKIELSTSNITVVQGASSPLQYTVKLYNGSTWGTTISIENSSTLAASGISISLSNTYADPTYSGTATVSASNSARPGNYTAYFVATGDDPSVSAAALRITIASPVVSTVTTTVATTTLQHQITPKLILVNSTTAFVNGTKGALLSLADNAIVAYIRPGTYVLYKNATYKDYNFTLDIFLVSNLGSPPNESQYIPVGAYAFEVNGNISPSFEFVNASGKPYAVISTVKAGTSITSWTFLGGTFNGTTYVGGNYAFADVWLHKNSTTMTNDAFVNPVVWIFEGRISAPATSSATTSIATTIAPTTTIPAKVSYSVSTYAYIIIAIIIIVILAYVYSRLRRRS
ncbi:MAG: hypothetical protein QW759_03295 [Candidatus Micrarchaeaceae archaeon]